MLHPGSNLRIIGINPFLFDSANPYIWRNTTNRWNIVFSVINNSWVGSKIL